MIARQNVLAHKLSCFIILCAVCVSAAAGTFTLPLSVTSGERTAITMVFADANPSPEIIRLFEFAGNFAKPDTPIPPTRETIPSPPLQWRLVYRDIYPGIDLVSYRAQGRVQYDMIVYPQADLSRVRILYQGLEKTELRGHFPGYQIIKGVRVPVPVEIYRDRDAYYILKPAPYDRNVELIVPTTQTPLRAVAVTVAAR